MSDDTLPVCIPGLQGLPVQVTGWIGYQEKDSLIVPNNIHFQFAPDGQPLQSTTFFMNGTQYFVSEIRLVSAKQEGLKDFSETPFLEFHIWGKPTATEVSKDTLALLVIPFYESYQASKTQTQIEQKDTLSSYIPQGDEVRILLYSSCIERQNGMSTLNVAYWATGCGVTAAFRKSRLSAIKSYGIPVSIVDNNFFLSAYEQYNDERKTKGKRIYNHDAEVSYPYFSSIFLSTTNDIFKKSFRMIKGFTIQHVNSAGKDINNYKCIRIDRQRDIQNGKLLIDPKTGKSLKEETEQADQELNASLNSPPDTSSKRYYMALLIIIGILVGLAGVALIIYGIQFLFGTRELTKQPAVSPETMVAAALSQNSPVK